jgi:DNA repair exonuclease SbcCD ATPase subunit
MVAMLPSPSHGRGRGLDIMAKSKGRIAVSAASVAGHEAAGVTPILNALAPEAGLRGIGRLAAFALGGASLLIATAAVLMPGEMFLARLALLGASLLAAAGAWALPNLLEERVAEPLAELSLAVQQLRWGLVPRNLPDLARADVIGELARAVADLAAQKRDAAELEVGLAQVRSFADTVRETTHVVLKSRESLREQLAEAGQTLARAGETLEGRESRIAAAAQEVVEANRQQQALLQQALQSSQHHLHAVDMRALALDAAAGRIAAGAEALTAQAQGIDERVATQMQANLVMEGAAREVMTAAEIVARSAAGTTGAVIGIERKLGAMAEENRVGHESVRQALTRSASETAALSASMNADLAGLQQRFAGLLLDIAGEARLGREQSAATLAAVEAAGQRFDDLQARIDTVGAHAAALPRALGLPDAAPTAKPRQRKAA